MEKASVTLNSSDLASWLWTEIKMDSGKLDRFQLRFKDNPAVALSAADDVFQAAARTQVYTEALNDLNKGGVKEVLKTLVKYLERRELGGSSHASSNLMTSKLMVSRLELYFKITRRGYD